jgi:predicted dehydrogenase
MIDGSKYLDRPLRWGMIGGGQGSMIGYIHRCAATRDNGFVLAAGALDIDEKRGKKFGEQLGVSNDRLYKDYTTMFTAEAKRSDGIEVVSIATPNNTHYEILKAALEAGLHAVCEKPLCFTYAQARELVELAKKKNLIVGLTYGYTCHQMFRQARKMVINGDLGEIRIINLQFAHGHQSSAVENNDPGTKWRVTPETAGPSYMLGDVGTHVLFFAKTMVPGLILKRILCTRQSFIKSRAPLEDNAYVLMEYENGIVGNMWVSSVNAGCDHGQKIRVIGSKASIEWWDERPNVMKYEIQGQPQSLMYRGTDYLYPEAREEDRIVGGHQEGLFEAWANMYRRFSLAIDAKNRDDEKFFEKFWYPGIEDGAEGVKFVERCVQSADAGAVWTNY